MVLGLRLWLILRLLGRLLVLGLNGWLLLSLRLVLLWLLVLLDRVWLLTLRCWLFVCLAGVAVPLLVLFYITQWIITCWTFAHYYSSTLSGYTLNLLHP